ncbi:unnamed protein product [Miscanthus lutarioriparius]|uniref:Uncharacterized protein n=1 Tax=Miscanthus lutarioriparius TaxID=422564 RepID=A0A811SGF4_9POAL|nr:unnamed protein product [Miscanthus lutarioriparius]
MALEGQIGNLAAFLKGMQARMDEQHQSMKKALEANTSVLHEPIGWKPKVQADVEELQSSVRELCTKVDHLAVKQEEVTNSAYRVFDTEHLNVTGSATTDLPSKPCGVTSGPSGHGDETIHRGSGNGVVTTLIPTPVTGVRNTKTLTPVAFPLGHAYSPEFTQYHLNHALPTVEFPEFDGSSPKLWIKKCNNYFDMYDVPDFLKSRTAYMHFSGDADFWAKSLDYPVQELAWPDLSRDPKFSVATITNRFIDGLKEDIRNVVLVHRPANLDTASSIALLQEEYYRDPPKKEFRKHESNTAFKYSGRNSSGSFGGTAASQGTDSSKTVRMVGNICAKEVIILIDSGSTHNFISESLASRWRNWSNHQCRAVRQFFKEFYPKYSLA